MELEFQSLILFVLNEPKAPFSVTTSPAVSVLCNARTNITSLGSGVPPATIRVPVELVTEVLLPKTVSSIGGTSGAINGQDI